MITLDFFTGSDLRIVHPLVLSYQEEDNRNKKLFIIQKISKELLRVKKSLEEEQNLGA